MKKILFFLFLISNYSIAQTREEIIEEFKRERAIMMEEIQKIFAEEFSGADSFFGDSDMDSLFDQRSITGGGNNISVEQKYEKDGSISILITPKNKNVNLDINTKNNMITIKSETKVEQVDEQSGNKSKSVSMSSFSKSISIPSGYKAKNPTQEGETIKIALIPQDKIKKLMVPKKEDSKVPIGKRPGEDTI